MGLAKGCETEINRGRGRLRRPGDIHARKVGLSAIRTRAAASGPIRLGPAETQWSRPLPDVNLPEGRRSRQGPTVDRGAADISSPDSTPSNAVVVPPGR